MKALGGESRTLLSREQSTLAQFDAALRQLGQSPLPIKRRVVLACAACITDDGKVTVREGELLRAICAVLGCPMPPLVAA